MAVNKLIATNLAAIATFVKYSYIGFSKSATGTKKMVISWNLLYYDSIYIFNNFYWIKLENLNG